MKKLLILILILVLSVTPLIASAEFNTHTPAALMSMTFKCGCKSSGTGVMIGRYGLLTAGHNLICRYHSKGLKSCIFLFGATSQYVGKKKYYNGFTYYYFDNFETGYKPDWDVGYVIFKYAVGDHTGWYNCRVCSDSDLQDQPVRIMNYNGSSRFSSSESVLNVESELKISWDGMISGGEGAPVCIWENDMPYVVGIYTNTSDGKLYGRRFTQELYDDMKANGAFD